jgi:hypothetical protein
MNTSNVETLYAMLTDIPTSTAVFKVLRLYDVD